MERNCRAIKAYRCAYPDPLRLRTGERVTLLDRQGEWPGWVFCVDASGKEGWVPESYLYREGDQGILRCDYDATELTVAVGDRLAVERDEAGWLWCADAGEHRGWVPASHTSLAPGGAQQLGPEYEGADARYYDLFATGLPGEAAFYVEEAVRWGSPVLELGCGTGRILIPLAEAGLQVVGLDRAPAMLEQARRKIAGLPPEVRGRIELVQGDMRVFSLERRFQLIAIPYRAFLHLLTVQDQREALGRVRAHLLPGGRLVLNIFDPSLEIIVAHQGPLGETLKRQEAFDDPATGRRVLLWDTRHFDLERQRLEQLYLFEALDPSGRVVERSYTPLTLRYIFRFEMAHLLELCGFRVEALYGDFSRGPFRHGGEQIWIATAGDDPTT